MLCARAELPAQKCKHLARSAHTNPNMAQHWSVAAIFVTFFPGLHSAVNVSCTTSDATARQTCTASVKCKHGRRTNEGSDS